MVGWGWCRRSDELQVESCSRAAGCDKLTSGSFGREESRWPAGGKGKLGLRPGASHPSPPTDEPGIWMGEATVSDIETGEVLAQPRVRFKTGEQAKLRSDGALGPDPMDEYHVVLEVSVGEAGETATCTSSVFIGGEIVSKQSASFKLK